jgi:glycosyltransferase involved in cell wall biosynthesis
MRILYYNWVEHADPERRGGGVAVYQRNLIEELLKDSSFEIYVLSSGISYNFRRRVYVREITGNGFPKRYEIVNSGVMAPGHSAFFSQSSLSHPETLGVFEEFLLTYGPFDVVHFNNLEGLPADVLSLRKRFPRTKFVLSLHNYFPFCPQVNLWYKEREHCSTYVNGRKCLHCLEYTVRSSSIKAAHRLAHYLKSLGIPPHGGV